MRIPREPGRVGAAALEVHRRSLVERPADITLGMQETLNNLAAVAQTQVNTT